MGPEPVPNFRMIERHYFKGDLIRSYDFNFGFCIPGSTNSWEAIYGVPEMTEKRIMDLMDSPFEMQSDSFYYVGDTLVMHNKASSDVRTRPPSTAIAISRPCTLELKPSRLDSTLNPNP